MNEVNEGMPTPRWEKFFAGFYNLVHDLIKRLALPLAGYRYVLEALDKPSRNVQSGVANVTGIYASQKMGLSIAFESRTLELSRIVENEANSDVLGYVAQLPPLKISYKCPRSGRTKSFFQRPDLLELYEDEILVVECKPIATLRKWQVDRPGFIYQDESGVWRCPPAEAACAELGLAYRLVCEQDLSPMRIKNLQFLMDYIQTGHARGREREVLAIVELLEDQRRLSLEEVREALLEDVSMDDIYRAIATGRVTVDLDAEPLADRDRTFLYSSAPVMASYKITQGAISRAATWLRSTVVDLQPGTLLNWNGRSWDLLNLGVTQVTLHQNGSVQELDRAIFDQLLKDKSIILADGGTLQADAKVTEAHRRLQAASPNDISHALKAYRSILPHQQGTAKSPPDRSERRHLYHWKLAEAGLGNGFVGLLPHFSLSGNRAPRLSKAVMRIVTEQTKDHYATTKKSRKLHIHERIVRECETLGFSPPSYSWFCRYIKRLPAYEMKRAREGRKAAYNLQPRKINDGSVTSATATVPWQRAYLDHTEIELETRCSSTSVLLGRPWLTTLIDDASADVLAFYLTWDPPSYRSVLMTLRDCVQRHGRLPEEIVVDGGKDMKSEWFEVFAAFHGVHITRRPAGNPRFGARGERVFGTIDTSLLSNCAGNTQLRKNVRQMTPEVDPNHKAVWTMEALQDAFERYFEHYRNLPHRELLLCPREIRERGVFAGSDRAERKIVYDRNFLIASCPTTKAGQAKVQSDGVKINYLYYNAPGLRLAFGKKVPVRFEPYDMSVAYALVEGEWMEVKSRFANELKNRTERELQLARLEYFKHRRQVEKARLTEKTFVEFLQYLDHTEDMLLDHHRANEMRRAAGPVTASDQASEEALAQDLTSPVALSLEHDPSSTFDMQIEDLPEYEVA